jgi:membrane associated rhomboid family serine protease
VGIYDRDYYREEGPGFSLRAPRTAVLTLVLVNVAVWLIDSLLWPQTRQLNDLLAAHVSTLTHPWMWWEFVTYGFMHDPHQFQHILFNMLALWFFGRDIEQLYGRAEFLRLYLLLLVVGGVAWAAIHKLAGRPDIPMIGASGAVAGVVLLYALNFPRRMILFMFILPMPAWVLGVLMVVGDMLGAFGSRPGDNIAYSVHLAGAAFALLYYRERWNFGRLLPGRFPRSWFRLRPSLRLHDPKPDEPEDSEESQHREQELDRILEKIHSQGESSLTRAERRILETASREYQKRRRVP